MNTISKTTPKTETNPPVTKIPFQHRLAESFQKHSHQVAIESGASHITYAQLASQADAVAHWITRAGIPPETFIGICLHDKIDMIALMVGIVKARCAFVVLDTALPPPRLFEMIRLTHLRIVFTSAQNKEDLFAPMAAGNPSIDEPSLRFIVVNHQFYLDNRVPPHADLPASHALYHREDKIYIYFTSGTTGTPKGIVGMNKSLLHFIDWQMETFGINKTFRFSQFITPGFDAFLRDVFTPLCAGAVICIPPSKEMVLDSQELIHWLNSRHIFLIHCVPSIFRLFNVFTHPDQAQKNLKTLRYVVMAGEKVIPGELSRWYAVFLQRVQLVNFYGTSETTMVKTFHFIQPEDCERSTIPVGKPLPGARIFILDKDLQVCHKKSPGEIFIRTPFRTHGYCNDPEATHEKFIPNPFTHDPNDWFYKTGDLGRLLEDGNLEVLGRMDRQVKIRGVRVEPEDIENVLLKHLAVAEAVIIDKENEQGETYLCAYFVPQKNHPDNTNTPAITQAQLHHYLATHLPPYMVPTYITPLDKMPLTSNGKIDRRALPEPQLDQGQQYEPPTTALEEKLVHIWAEVLNVEPQKISINANFFHLGGHSLNATIMVSKIHRLLGVKVPLAEIFKTPFIKALSQFMTANEVPGKSFFAIEPTETREYYPLSSAQKRLYFLQQFDLTSTSYNMPMVIPLGKGVDIPKLDQVLQAIILRHENFRTAFIQVQDETFQRIFPQVDFAFDVFDLGDPVIHNSAAQVGVVIQNFVRPFDLSRAPLFRCGLIRIPEDEYIWLLDMHHIISDGTSQTILTRDFFALSQDQLLPPLQLQYKDFSQWQNRLFAEGSIKAQEQFWMSQLAGELPRLDFPTDYQRPPIFTFAGARDTFNLEPQDALHFRALGDTLGATLYMNILAALNVLFFKYTQQTDIIIGSAIAGRHHADLQHIVGMFVNTLVLRNAPQGDKTYLSFLNEVRESCIHVFENQDVQFEQLVEKLDLERDPSRNPLFDISLVVQNFIQTGQEIETNEIDPQFEVVSVPASQTPSPQYESHISKFDMTFFINEIGQDISIHVQYYTGIFKPETIHRFISHLTQLIKIVNVDPTIPLNDIQLLTEPEKQWIVYELNNTHREYPAEKTIHQLFAEQMHRTPHHVALNGATVGASPRGCPDLAPCPITCQITYAQLHAQSSHLAQILINKGVCPGDIIGILGERSINTIIGILGILKAGGAYLPIDPDYPEERKHFMVADSCARIILTEESIHEFIWGAFSETRATTGGCPYGCPIPAQSSNLAYVIYTSGSTGQPKGVMVEHRNVVRLVKNTNYIDFLPHDRIQQTGALEFDASTFEIWGALLNGLPLCIESKEDILNPELLRHFILRNKITILWLTTQLFNQMVQMEIHLFATLRCVLTGGEVASPPHIRQLMEQFPRLRLIHCYGPTENTTFSTTDVFQPQLLEKISIGKPIANSTAYIVDPAGHVLPIGIVGELWVGGDGVARGYLNNPELTAATFISHTLLSTPSTPFYKTGDLARWLPDGNIDFMGRKDHQVKIRGFRIELGEIETQLLTHPHIQEAVVLVREDQKTEKYLCAYIVSTAPCDDSQLREYLGKTLPDYMIPTFFVPLQKIPLNASGKIDRKVLPRPQLKSAQEIEAPRNELERQLVAIWSEVLNIEPHRVGINSHFFQLGGHSLNATIVVSKIHRQLGFKIPLAELFKTPFIKGLSQYITSQRDPGKQFFAIEPAETREYYPLSSAQKRLYFLQQFDLTSTVYNMPMVIPLGTGIDSQELDGILQALIQRHDNFRTSFIQVQDETVQRILPRVDFAFEVFDLSAPNAAPIGPLIHHFVRPFDLSRAPLLRCGLIRTPEDQYIWLVDMHHIISDGTSQSILTQDFFALAQGQQLPPLQLQYKDFSQWQNRLFAEGSIKTQEEYWLSQLAGELPRLDLPADFKRPPVFTFAGARDSFKLESQDAIPFRALGNTHGATLYMNMLALLNVLFFKYTQQTDIIIGSAIAGRHHADLQHIVGMFVNTLVLRHAPQGEKTYDSFLKEVCESSIHAFENQDVQFEQLVEKLDLERDPSRNPLFDISLVVQNFFQAGSQVQAQDNPLPLATATVPASQSPQYESHFSKFDMTFFINEIGQNISIDVQYYTGIFKPETIKRLLSHLSHLIQTVIQNPAIPLKDIQIISDQEKHQLLYEFNDPQARYPMDKTIHLLFEEQVLRTPQQVALDGTTMGASQLSYTQLNDKANALAQVILSQGIPKNQFIGLLAHRSVEIIIGILAIWKSGCAYIPLNPQAPASRSLFMLKDCVTPLLLTTSLLAQESETVSRFEGQLLIIEDREVEPRPLPPVSPSQLAYVIYTSGSTGTPKGVPITHTNLCPLLYWSYRHLPMGTQDRALQNISYFFDWSVWEIFSTLTTGAALYIVPDEILLNPATCISFMKENRITLFHITPTQYQHLISEGLPLETLKYLFLGAEKLGTDLLNRSFASVPQNCRVFNMYGPTETTIISSALEIHRGQEQDFVHLNSVPIGVPVSNHRLLVLDHYYNLCPIHLAGQLFIAGPGLASGYLNNPELTATTFLSLSTSFTSGNKTLYKTGDLARWLLNGTLQFLGRIDHQVKIRGFRIELGEIENQLLAFDQMKGAVVLARQDNDGENYLCAYIVSPVSWQNSELRDGLAKELPDYMIPAYFVPVPQIPLTPNGKIDVKALPLPQLIDQETYMAPQNEIESQLVEIWSLLLNLEKNTIGTQANFFQIGGHSLKATILASAIHKRLNVKIPLAEIFKNPTIQRLAEYIRHAASTSYVSIPAVEKKEFYILSSLQKRLYILQQMNPHGVAYNMPQVIPLGPSVDTVILTRTITQLLQRHESLRTSFQIVDDLPVQKIHETDDLLFKLEEYQGSSFSQIMDRFIRPFDLTIPPLCRVGLVNLFHEGESLFVLMVDIHHIIFDGVSKDLLVRDFGTLLTAAMEGQTETLPALRLQYKDYAQWQNSPAQKIEIKKQEAYWLHEFEGEIPVLNLPHDFPRPENPFVDGDDHRFRLDKQTSSALFTLAAEQGVTVYMMCLTLLNVLLAKLCGQEDIIIGTLSAGRQHADLQNIIGMFVNTLVLRNYPSSEKTFTDFLKEIKQRILAAFENQDYPFEDLVDKVVPVRSINRNPLFDVWFNYVELEDTLPTDPDGDPAETQLQEQPFLEYETHPSKFDMTFVISKLSADELYFTIKYSPRLFKKETIKKVMESLQEIATRVVENPGGTIAQINIVSPVEMADIWDDSSADLENE